MNKINWKLAPEGAIGVAQRGQQLAFVDNDRNIFLDGHRGISMGWELVAKRPTFAESITKTPQLEQTKTVADAVEWANGKWKDDCQYMLYHEELGKFSFVVSEGPYVNGWQLVCTREQFEAYVEEQEKPQPHFKATRENLEKIAKDAQGDFVEVEQEGEKWTHITPLGSKCKVLAVDGEHSWVLTEHGSRTTEFASSLKPIKPTISQEQAKAVMEFATEHGLISEGQIWTSKEREIIEGTAND